MEKPAQRTGLIGRDGRRRLAPGKLFSLDSMGSQAPMTPKSGAASDPLLEHFWDKGLVLIGDRVQQEYALRTPIFIDLRHKLYDDLEVLLDLGRALLDKLRRVVEREGGVSQPQQVIGIPDTATPLALTTALVSHLTSWPLSYGQMRKKPASYPGGRSGCSSYMGTIDPERQITLIDDVMASGRTKRWALNELRKQNLEAARILVVVDREQGGQTELGELSCPLYSLYKISELIEYYARTRKIDESMARKALDHVHARQFA